MKQSNFVFIQDAEGSYIGYTQVGGVFFLHLHSGHDGSTVRLSFLRGLDSDRQQARRVAKQLKEIAKKLENWAGAC